jgi:hypothetical protein
MRNQKTKPGSFVDRAESKALFFKDKRIDLRKYWATNDDTELDPGRVASLNVARAE